jgi:hypothetical protein
MVTSDTLATSPDLEPPPRQSHLKKLVSFPALLAVALVGAMFVPLREFFADPDVWWHLKVGATLLSTHRWPSADPYSFTAHGSPWIAYEWLGEVLLAAVERAWGLQGLMALDLALTAAILLALYALATLRCRNSKAAFVVCAVSLPLVYLSCSLRPQMLGYLFLVLTLLALERFRQGRTGALWLLPLLFLVWVNTHGSFVIGLGALGVYGASGLVHIQWGELRSRLWTSGERLRLELVALLTLVALTLTPYGTEVCLYPLNMAFSQPINVGNIKEWQSMMFGAFFGKLFLALVLGFLLAQVTLRPAWHLAELALFFAGIVAACLHVRFVLVFVPFSVPLLAVILARWIPPYEPSRDKYPLNALLMVLAVAGMVWFFPSRAKLESVMEEKWPVKAVTYLKQHPVPRPMYNTYGYGGYLIWQLHGQNKVFVDGRADTYERVGVLADYLSISRLAPTTPFLLDAYNVQSCLLDRDEPLATLLAASPGWRRVYSDKLSALFVRCDQNLEARPRAEHDRP